MSQVLIYMLLILALVIPVLGTIALRLLGERLSEVQLLWSATALFGVAILSVLVLAFSSISSLAIGNVTVLLPLVNPANDPLPAPLPVEPPNLPPVTAEPAMPELAATVTPDRSDVPATTPSLEATAITTPTTTITPSATPEPPSATPEPPSATPEPAPEPPPPQTYTVEPGDTLRGIAQQFDVSVEALLEANNLTPGAADALRPGQELIIP